MADMWTAPTAESLRKAKKEEDAKPVVLNRQTPNEFWDEAQRQLNAAHNTIEQARVAGASLYSIVEGDKIVVEACCHGEAMSWMTRNVYNSLEGKSLIKGQRQYRARKQSEGRCNCMSCS